MLNTYRKKIDKFNHTYVYESSKLEHIMDKKSLATKELEDHKKVREIYQQAGVNTQSYLEKHISAIVTNALRTIWFEKDIEFVAKFQKQRNSTECELYVIDNGEVYDILDDKGFGIADVASFALRVAYVLLDSSDKVIIFDEPFRNLDKVKIPYASKMVQELSHKLGIQFIIVTHLDDLTECADNVITVKMDRNTGISEVSQ